MYLITSRETTNQTVIQIKVADWSREILESIYILALKMLSGEYITQGSSYCIYHNAKNNGDHIQYRKNTKPMPMTAYAVAHYKRVHWTVWKSAI